MTALAERTVDVTPLGRRGRYSMTSKGQQRLYLALVFFMDRHGYAPTFDEMVAATGGTRSGTHMQLKALDDCDWIKTERDRKGWMKARGIALTEPVLRNLRPVTQ